jgi:hypothetical protein
MDDVIRIYKSGHSLYPWKVTRWASDIQGWKCKWAKAITFAAQGSMVCDEQGEYVEIHGTLRWDFDGESAFIEGGARDAVDRGDSSSGPKKAPGSDPGPDRFY